MTSRRPTFVLGSAVEAAAQEQDAPELRRVAQQLARVTADRDELRNELYCLDMQLKEALAVVTAENTDPGLQDSLLAAEDELRRQEASLKHKDQQVAALRAADVQHGKTFKRLQTEFARVNAELGRTLARLQRDAAVRDSELASLRAECRRLESEMRVRPGMAGLLDKLGRLALLWILAVALTPYVDQVLPAADF